MSAAVCICQLILPLGYCCPFLPYLSLSPSLSLGATGNERNAASQEHTMNLGAIAGVRFFLKRFRIAGTKNRSHQYFSAPGTAKAAKGLSLEGKALCKRGRAAGGKDGV